MAGEAQQANAVTGTTRTGQVLARTRNRAVLPVLLAGLHSTRAEVRNATIRAAVRRHELPTHTQLIQQFASLSEADRIVLGEAHSAMPHHAAPALKAAILGSDKPLCKNACRMIAISGDVDLIPVLVKAAEDKKHHHSSEAAATILELATRVQRELAQWAAGNRAGGHDPAFKRHHVLVSLEPSMSRFVQHRRQEILDSFLLLAPVDNKTLNKILHDTSHPCHVPVVTELATTQDIGIMERLVGLFRDTDAPAAALKIVASRTDERFVDVLLNGLQRPVPIRVLHNMKRVAHVAWLEEQRKLLLDLDGRAKRLPSTWHWPAN